MIERLRTTVTQVAEAALGIVGVRVGTEEPPHTTETLTDAVEIRRYEPRIAAETVVDADEERARNEGFRRLAGYIFGGNRGSDTIAMTAPVAQSASRGQTIAMTAPVSRAASDEGWVVRFFMPSRWTMDTLPAPKDDRVRLVEVPAETVAVLRFSGDRGAEAVAARTAELLDTLHSRGIDTTGEPMSWFYDPPWTVSFRRRNEIAVPVAR
ncbi:heme-binding protein [Rhodococcus sp. BP-349]|uniref:SOUL family heme-binding protein n=1 Tax=unclassified Rhodococcus (in: high G+C Gram-positive bacteria) TaxID=192944 RepID=UPI001C9A8208|nr:MULTISPECIES: heme-binding protein [unclassified Rhodococcus (in: high G+C Gram-positive bacteria)]MBY6537390.1 heme-binding protein [Rhodococcus sp. BP-363]MBY6541727.1 heme-binding protein [Rhodococcus sp. BP-369]MBY6560957.1 heme-binding protein [Rhodococcus sp. BP-370]MBY6575249.1 heme-binding protein [Rhodococcus sp. BP-364]MBY6584550.1 heme-binding protein [Rhodococcus sp. BP-358]